MSNYFNTRLAEQSMAVQRGAQNAGFGNLDPLLAITKHVPRARAHRTAAQKSEALALNKSNGLFSTTDGQACDRRELFGCGLWVLNEN
jgi:hypothetical protein